MSGESGQTSGSTTRDRKPVAATRHHGALPVGAEFSNDRVLQCLVVGYLILWSIAAIAPPDRMTWLLENLLVFVLVGTLVATHRRFAFSMISYCLIISFLTFHALGAHYTYSAVPLGDWIRDVVGLARNPYDRFVHFCFGLLLAYPLRELCLRVVHVHGLWSYLAPIVSVLALSSIYEIIESWAARIVDPSVGLAYVGAQGDVWDGQKDMSLALLGAVLAVGLAALDRNRSGREAYLGPLNS